jgi:hypothetical protein
MPKVAIFRAANPPWDAQEGLAFVILCFTTYHLSRLPVLVNDVMVILGGIALGYALKAVVNKRKQVGVILTSDTLIAYLPNSKEQVAVATSEASSFSRTSRDLLAFVNSGGIAQEVSIARLSELDKEVLIKALEEKIPVKANDI